MTAGSSHTCALTSAGGVKCWGRNQSGQLGDGTTTSSPVPVDVSGLGSGVSAIDASGAGSDFTCALTEAGGVKCWGHNTSGQLGDGSTTTSDVPVDVVGLQSGVSAIAVGLAHACALTSAGAVKCWGSGFFGELGNGANPQSSPVPVDVSGLGSGVIAIGAGVYHSCAVTDAGDAKCWGRNDFGQLRDGTHTPSNIPVDVGGPGDFGAIAGGAYYTCALTSGGAAMCWGATRTGNWATARTRTAPSRSASAGWGAARA